MLEPLINSKNGVLSRFIDYYLTEKNIIFEDIKTMGEKILGKRGSLVINIGYSLVYLTFLRIYEIDNIGIKRYHTHTNNEQEWEVIIRYNNNPNTDVLYNFRDSDTRKFITMLQLEDRVSRLKN